MGKEDLLYFWKGKFDKKLTDAFLGVPRENFVRRDYRNRAYDDGALPLIKGQTISQPTTVMMMLGALELKEDDRVLEIGGGCGYVGALLCKLVKDVTIIEIDEDLYNLARENLKDYNVDVKLGDGTKIDEKFDKILVSAAIDSIKDLKDKLNENGILVVPVGHPISKLMKIKDNNEECLGDFIFVPIRH